jgi:DNA-binding GntR family transcriptional regulator
VPRTLTRPRSKSNEVYHRLIKLLESGEFQPGERLSELKLSRMLGTKRGPIREAMLRLEAAGLLRSEGAYKGRYVEFIEAVKPEQVLARYELRELIESGAARLAAKSMTGWEIDELRRLHTQMTELGSTSSQEELYRASSAFHHYLLAHCGNALLLQAWETFGLTPMMAQSEDLHSKILANLPEHGKNPSAFGLVVDAIAAHDAPRAEVAMRDLLQGITDAIRKSL